MLYLPTVRNRTGGTAPKRQASHSRLASALVALVAAFGAIFVSGPVAGQSLIYTYENTTSGAIPGNTLGLDINGSPGTNCSATNSNAVVRTFTVSDSFTVDAAAVGLNIAHTTRSEIAVTLRAPSGLQRSILSWGGTDTDNNYDVMVSDLAEVSLDDNDYDDLDEPYYHRDALDPTDDNLDDFVGQASAGTWTIYICDDNNDGETGTFNRARLVLTDSTSAATVCTSTDSYEWGDNGDGNGFSSATFGDITLTEDSTSDVYGNGLASANFLTLTGPQGGHTGYYGLGMSVEPGDDPLDTEVDESGAQIVTFSFSPPARDLSFDLLDIDQGGFEDVVRIRALDSGGSSLPVEATPINTSEIYGDLFSGDSTAAPTATDGNVEIFVAGPVSTMTLEFQSGSAPNDPGDQFIGITDFSLCAWDFDDAPDSYGTDLGTGARHGLGDRDLFLGTAPPDGEADGQPVAAGADNSGANGDGTEDDGVASFPGSSTLDGVYTTTVTVTNDSGSAATLCGWIDFGQDGTYESDEGSCVTVPSSGDNGSCTESSPGVFSCTVSWTVPVADRGNSGNFYSRFRVTTDSMSTSEPTGAKSDGEVEGYRVSISSLPVTLAFFEATASKSGTTVRFVTATETSNVGFELFGLQDGTWHPAATIPSRVVDSAVATEYEVELPWRPEAYLLVDLDARGGERAHGPFVEARAYGESPRTQLVDWPRVAAEARAAAERRGFQRKSGFAQVDDVALVRVTTPGIQRVSHDDLLAAGIDWTGLDPGSIAVFDAGEPQPRHVDCPARGVWGAGCALEIVVDVEPTLSSAENVLELRIDRDAARPAATFAGTSGKRGTAAPATRRVEVAPERQYSFASPTGDPWFDGRLLSFGAPAALERGFELPDLEEGPATLELTLWGGTDLPSSPDHHVVVALDGVEIADLRFDGIVEERATIDVEGLLARGTNHLELAVPGDVDGPFDLVHLEGFSVTYPGRTTARDGRYSSTELVSQPGASRRQGYAVAGFESAEVIVWTQSQGVSSTGGWARSTIVATEAAGDDAGTFVVDVPPGTVRVEAVEAARVARPRVEPATVEPVRSVEADVVLLTPPVFEGRVGELVALQERRGFEVEVVSTEAVYAAWSDHALDPEALREFLAASDRRRALRFVQLVGGDTYDPLDHLGLGSVAHVPTLYTELSDIVRFAPSDELLVDFDGDAVPDLPIGRLPARTLAELEAMIEKAVRRGDAESSVSASSALLVSGRSDLDDELARLNETMALGLGAGWEVALASADDADVEALRSRIATAFGERDLISYLGHSAYAQWDFTPLLTAADVPDLPLGETPPVVAQWGCWNGYFVSPEVETLSSVLLAEPERGAAVALGSTSLTSPASHRELARRFFDAVSGGATTVGEALLEAKRELAAAGGHDDAVLGIVLLGDPATPIGIGGRVAPSSP